MKDLIVGQNREYVKISNQRVKVIPFKITDGVVHYSEVGYLDHRVMLTKDFLNRFTMVEIVPVITVLTPKFFYREGDFIRFANDLHAEREDYQNCECPVNMEEAVDYINDYCEDLKIVL